MSKGTETLGGKEVGSQVYLILPIVYATTLPLSS